jgi:hypothetical protein
VVAAPYAPNLRPDLAPGEPLHRILVLAKQTRHFLVELTDLRSDQSQFLQRHFEKRR